MNNKVISKVLSGITLCSVIGYTMPVFGYLKDETVYTKLDNTGENYKTIVSTHIVNDNNSDIIDDLSDLLNIKNTSGNEEFIQDGNKLTWKSNKNDIFYQGESSKELPIECTIKYELNGEEISAENIAGKSGTVKITLEYKNKEERIVNINGKEIKMYVPFVVAFGTVINNENASNIKISSGKIINDGTKSIVTGIVVPGLQESLGISKTDVDIPNNIEITMDAKNFEMSNIISYVTPKILEKDDLNMFNKVDKLYGEAENLQSSMNQIQDGITSLTDGTKTLTSGTIQLKNGTLTAYNGANQISSEVNKSIKSLSLDNTNALDEQTLKAIETQAESSSILTPKQKEDIIIVTDKGIDDESAIIKEQFVANAKQIAEETALQTAMSTAKIVAKQTAMQTAISLNPNLTNEQLEAIGEQASSSAVLTDTQKIQIKKQADNGIEAKRTAIEQQGITSIKAISQKVAITSAQAGATIAAKKTASTVANQVGNTVKATASKTVVSQMKTLSNGLNQLTNGLNTLNTGATDLENGAIALQNGSETLKTGIITYNEEGISKICNYIQNNVKNLSKRIEKLTELSKDYSNFTMLNKENEGNVKFIMIIDAIKSQETIDESKQQIFNENNKN